MYELSVRARDDVTFAEIVRHARGDGSAVKRDVVVFHARPVCPVLLRTGHNGRGPPGRENNQFRTVAPIVVVLRKCLLRVSGNFQRA